MIYSKKTPWFDVTIDENLKQVLVEQRWRIFWSYGPGSTRWTDQEKREFMVKVKIILNSTWGKAFKVHMDGKSEFARKHSLDTLPVRFKIYPTTAEGHWKVLANKVLPKYENRSYTTWGSRTIELYQDNVESVKKTSGDRQYVVAHEIGHTLGNLEDEYEKESSHFYDKPSIMSNGMFIRRRHFDFILSELNTLIPKTHFYL